MPAWFSLLHDQLCYRLGEYSPKAFRESIIIVVKRTMWFMNLLQGAVRVTGLCGFPLKLKINQQHYVSPSVPDSIHFDWGGLSATPTPCCLRPSGWGSMSVRVRRRVGSEFSEGSNTCLPAIPLILTAFISPFFKGHQVCQQHSRAGGSCERLGWRSLALPSSLLSSNFEHLILFLLWQ